EVVMLSSATWLSRLYRLLLYAYPPDFRRRYGREMTQVFREQCRSAAHTRGARGMLFFVILSFADWLTSTIRKGVDSMNAVSPPEHACEGAPVFYFCGGDRPRMGARINGGVLSIFIFSLLLFLIVFRGSCSRQLV